MLVPDPPREPRRSDRHGAVAADLPALALAVALGAFREGRLDAQRPRRAGAQHQRPLDRARLVAADAHAQAVLGHIASLVLALPAVSDAFSCWLGAAEARRARCNGRQCPCSHPDSSAGYRRPRRESPLGAIAVPPNSLKRLPPNCVSTIPPEPKRLSSLPPEVRAHRAPWSTDRSRPLQRRRHHRWGRATRPLTPGTPLLPGGEFTAEVVRRRLPTQTTRPRHRSGEADEQRVGSPAAGLCRAAGHDLPVASAPRRR